MTNLPPRAAELLAHALDGRLAARWQGAAVEIDRRDAELAPVWAAMRAAVADAADFDHAATCVLMGSLEWMARDRAAPMKDRRAALARAERAEAAIQSRLTDLQALLEQQATDIQAAGATPADAGARVRLVSEAIAARSGARLGPTSPLSVRQATADRIVEFLAVLGESVGLAVGSWAPVGNTRALLPDSPPAPQWAAQIARARGDRVRAVGLTDEHLAALCGVALGDAEPTADAIAKLRRRRLAGLHGYGAALAPN